MLTEHGGEPEPSMRPVDGINGNKNPSRTNYRRLNRTKTTASGQPFRCPLTAIGIWILPTLGYTAHVDTVGPLFEWATYPKSDEAALRMQPNNRDILTGNDGTTAKQQATGVERTRRCHRCNVRRNRPVLVQTWIGSAVLHHIKAQKRPSCPLANMAHVPPERWLKGVRNAGSRMPGTAALENRYTYSIQR